jgi:hypothetical protein
MGWELDSDIELEPDSPPKRVKKSKSDAGRENVAKRWQKLKPVSDFDSQTGDVVFDCDNKIKSVDTQISENPPKKKGPRPAKEIAVEITKMKNTKHQTAIFKELLNDRICPVWLKRRRSQYNSRQVVPFVL